MGMGGSVNVPPGSAALHRVGWAASAPSAVAAAAALPHSTFPHDVPCTRHALSCERFAAHWPANRLPHTALEACILASRPRVVVSFLRLRLQHRSAFASFRLLLAAAAAAA